MTTTFYGLDDLRHWLEQSGFKISQNHFDRDNGCNWYAYRKTEIPARECECNEGKKMQIVIKPFAIREYESCEVNVTGEAGDEWYSLNAYSVNPKELHDRLPKIEASLIAAWNALT